MHLPCVRMQCPLVTYSDLRIEDTTHGSREDATSYTTHSASAGHTRRQKVPPTSTMVLDAIVQSAETFCPGGWENILSALIDREGMHFG